MFTCLATTQQRQVKSPRDPGVVSLHVNAGHFSTTARRVTSPTWGPPPPCKQALSVISLSLPLRLITFTKTLISNGNMTEWSPIRSVIIQVITKSDDRAAGVRFVHHEYDYRPNWTQSYYLLIIKITISEKRRIAKL